LLLASVGLLLVLLLLLLLQLLLLLLEALQRALLVAVGVLHRGAPRR
jgi:hypothetical protein